MAVVYHEIYLPIDTESTFDYIVIKQGDAGTHRVRATLISNNRVYTIPTSGVSYYMKFRKPDNNYVLVQATVADNTISAEVTEEMLRVSGTGRGEFMIVSGSDELKTATFHVKIVKETFTSGDVQSHSDFAPFAALLQGAGAAASNANTAAAAANAAASLAEQKAQAIPDDYSDLVAEVAGKADQSNTYTKAQVDGLIEDVTVKTDTTLAVSGAPADAAETGRQFGLINESLATLADITPIPDNSDLNNYGETGLYSIEYGNYTILNYPPVAIAGSYLEVRKMTNGYVGQKLTIPGNGKVFTRRRFNNGQWNDWIQITGLKTDLTDAVKEALIACFANVEWAGSNPNGDLYINALKNALGMTVSKTLTYPSGGLGSVGGRIQMVSSSDRTATINAVALQTCTVGASSANANTANLAFNGIYGIKQGSFTKIKYYATTTSTNSSAHFNIGYVVCKIIDGVYTISSMSSTVDTFGSNGIEVNLPENPNNDNYIFLKVEGVNTNARTELAALKMVLIEAPNGGSQTPSTPTQEIVFTPNLNIMAEMDKTPELVIRNLSQRQSFGAISDEPKVIAYPSLSPSNYSLIRVPSGKTTVTVTYVTPARCNLAWFDLTDTYQGNPYYHFINQTGWQAKANTFTFDITGKEYIAINFESTDSNSSNYTLTMS